MIDLQPGAPGAQASLICNCNCSIRAMFKFEEKPPKTLPCNPFGATREIRPHNP